MDDSDDPTSAPESTDPIAAPPRRRRRVAIAGAGLALAVGLFSGGAWAGWSVADPSSTTTSALEQDSAASRATVVPPSSGFDPRTFPGAGSGATTTDATSATAATAAHQVGLVTIVTTLGYEDAQAAGTGIVLTADGEILTNNHVIDGATELEVTVESTGAVYAATVVGTDATADVAVLQLADASGLATAPLDSGGAAIGEAITAVGNAEGAGELLAAAGTVTALEESITTQSEGSSAGHDLSGLIQIDADVVSGDSGGAVLDAEGEVVGMTTAASSGTANISGYAIPIATALDAAAQITSGVEADGVTIGYPAFLGVALGSSQGAASGASGALIAGAFDGTPAAGAGIAAGDTITSLGGVAVGSGDTLGDLLSGYEPGDQVAIAWTTAAGGSESATVTLIAGPAD